MLKNTRNSSTATCRPFIEFADIGNAEREKRRLGQKLKENAGELGMVDFLSSEDEEVGIIPSADAALHDKTYPTKPGRRPAGGRKLTDLPDGTDEAAAIGRSRKP